MTNDLRIRKGTRLPDYDYTLPGAYFITICTNNGECIFGEIVEEKICLNQYGEIVNDEWIKTAQIRPYIELDTYIVMPDHFHCIFHVLYRLFHAKLQIVRKRTSANGKWTLI